MCSQEFTTNPSSEVTDLHYIDKFYIHSGGSLGKKNYYYYYYYYYYITSHHITLYYITLHTHFTDPTFVPRQLNVHKTTHTGFIKGHINMCKNIK